MRVDIEPPSRDGLNLRLLLDGRDSGFFRGNGDVALLPCWSHLSAEAYRERVASLVTEVASEAAAELAEVSPEPLGVAAILHLDNVPADC
jgi:hypothetical protein